jgi:hypothetical protein
MLKEEEFFLTLPIPLHNDSDFSILQYADDTLIFMHGDVNQLLHLKDFAPFIC